MTDVRAVGRRMLATAGAAGLTVLVLGYVILASFRADLMAEAERELQLLASLHVNALRNAVEQVEAETAMLSELGTLRQSLRVYAQTYRALGPAGRDRVLRLYADENPHPEDRRHLLLDAGDGSAYSALHARGQTAVRDFLAIHRYDDVLMLDTEGTVIYTYRKAGDFGANVDDEALQDTGLADAFRNAMAHPDSAYATISDLKPYPLAGSRPALFVASAVRDEGASVGVFAVRIDGDAVTRALRSPEGLGASGDVYAVGEDLRLRSDSRFTEASDVLALRVESEAVRRALNGESAVVVTRDFRGERVVSAFGMIAEQGIRWAIVAERSVSEILAPARRLRRILVITGLIVALLVTLAVLPDARTAWLKSPVADSPAH